MDLSFNAEDGSAIRLGREVGRGGEGSVYEVEGKPGHCAKIYAASVVNLQLHDKLLVMAANPPKDPTVDSQKHHSIAWPTRLLYRGAAEASHFAGFMMPMIADTDFKKAICRFHPGDRVKQSGGKFTWQHAYSAACNISSAVAAVHERGYCIGDINESNILVAGNTLATLIDCDSFQVKEAGTGRVFRCVVGKGEYTAPELAGKTYGDVDRTPATDHFGLAVLLFQFLMEGCHPYQARGPLVEEAPSTEKKISLGYFPYRHAGKPEGVSPPLYAPPFDILHPDMQKLFVRAFVDGHKEPSARPTSKEWFEGLGKLRKQVIECRANRRHWYFSQLTECPWCRMKKEKGKDPFEPAQKTAAAPRVSRRIAPSAGRPVLWVSNTSFGHRIFVPGLKIRDLLIVENAGGGALSGTVKSNREWLKLSRSTLDPATSSQEIELEIDTKELNPDFNYSAQVEIQTNGGRTVVSVIVGPELALAGAAAASVKGGEPASAQFRMFFALGSAFIGMYLGEAAASMGGYKFEMLSKAGAILAWLYFLIAFMAFLGLDSLGTVLVVTALVGLGLGKLYAAASASAAGQAGFSWAMLYLIIGDLICGKVQSARTRGNRAMAWTAAAILAAILAFILVYLKD